MANVRDRKTCILNASHTMPSANAKRVGTTAFFPKFRKYAEEVLGIPPDAYDVEGHLCQKCELKVKNHAGFDDLKEDLMGETPSRPLGNFNYSYGCLPVQFKRYREAILTPSSNSILILDPIWFKIVLRLSYTGELISYALESPSLAQYLELGGGRGKLELWPSIVECITMSKNRRKEAIPDSLDHLVLLAYEKDSSKVILYNNGDATDVLKYKDPLWLAVQRNLLRDLSQRLLIQVTSIELFRFQKSPFLLKNTCFVNVIYVIKLYFEGKCPPQPITEAEGGKFIENLFQEMEDLGLKVGSREGEKRGKMKRVIEEQRKQDMQYHLDFFKFEDVTECLLLKRYKEGVYKDRDLNLTHVEGFMAYFLKDKEGRKLILGKLESAPPSQKKIIIPQILDYIASLKTRSLGEPILDKVKQIQSGMK